MSTISIFSSDERNPEALLKEFFTLNPYFSEEEAAQITKAWELLVQKSDGVVRSCGKPYYMHPLRLAALLSENKLDSDTIIAGLLSSVMEFGVTQDDLTREFGEGVANIIVTAEKILKLPINTKNLHQSDAIRKMFFAMSDNPRVILIALADRLDRLRNLRNYTKGEQKVIAEAAIEIWAPLADRLGMQKEKNEFEDLSLKYTNPAAFQQIKSVISQKKEERASYLQNAVDKIQSSAKKLGMEISIQSRAKHFYSIYQKMRKRNKEIDELYDLLALRILCNTPGDCYTLVGVVHGLWKPLDGRFKDYIAMPKSNGYQSLHTTVMCDGKPLEIQIRTFQMHDTAEHGIASHWLYKKGTNKDLVEAEKLDIFNKLQQFKETLLTDESSFTTLKNELLGDEIYVFTPKGDVRKLPAGATAIDFAYSIHSAIGEKIVAAKADGKIIPLNRPLENTQIIEIITNPNSHPTENQLAIVKTTKAHQKIHSWLMANDPTFSEKFEKERLEPPEVTAAQKRRHKHSNNNNAPDRPQVRDVLIQGEKNVLYNFAQCCKPKYPDLICGYVTRTKGVSIHRADCLVYQRIPTKNQRNVEVKWDDENL